MDSLSSSSPSPIDVNLKKWAHFPEQLQKSYEIAKSEGVFSLGNRKIVIDNSESLPTFFIKVVLELKEEGGIDSKNIRKLFKINNESNFNEAAFITKIALSTLLKGPENLGDAENFCHSFLNDCKKWDESEFGKQLMDFIQNDLENSPIKINDFATALALESPTLLYFALPYLHLSRENQRFISQLAISNPLIRGLENTEHKQSIINSISIEKWIKSFRVKTEESDNIRGLLRYMANQLVMVSQFTPVDAQKFPAHDLYFLTFMNGVFKYGIVCRARAEKLGIIQVSSLDKNPRPANEVEVNCISQQKGLEVAIYHQAKGAMTVATERREDPLAKKVVMQSVEVMKGYSMSIPTITDPEALSVISERTHYCILIMSKEEALKFKDNEGKLESEKQPIAQEFHRECSQSSMDGCREVKINANIDPHGFLVVAMSERFEPYVEFLNVPKGMKIDFVSTLKNQQINYGFRDEKEDARVCKVIVDVPDLKGALTKFAETLNDKTITHISKGKCKYDY